MRGWGEVRRDVSLSGAGRLKGRVADQAGRAISGAAVTLTDARGEVVATTVSGRSAQCYCVQHCRQDKPSTGPARGGPERKRYGFSK